MSYRNALFKVTVDPSLILFFRPKTKPAPSVLGMTLSLRRRRCLSSLYTDLESLAYLPRLWPSMCSCIKLSLVFCCLPSGRCPCFLKIMLRFHFSIFHIYHIIHIFEGLSSILSDIEFLFRLFFIPGFKEIVVDFNKDFTSYAYNTIAPAPTSLVYDSHGFPLLLILSPLIIV